VSDEDRPAVDAPAEVPSEAIVVQRTGLAPETTADRFTTRVGDLSFFEAHRCPTDADGRPVLTTDGLAGTDDDCAPEAVLWRAGGAGPVVILPNIGYRAVVMPLVPGSMAIGTQARDGLQAGASLEVEDGPRPDERLVIFPPIVVLDDGATQAFDVYRCPTDPSMASGPTGDFLMIGEAPASGADSWVDDLADAASSSSAAEGAGCVAADPNAATYSWEVVGNPAITLGLTTGVSTLVTGADRAQAALVVREDGVASGLAFISAEFAGTCPTEGLPGDFDGDGDVDAADYVVWRKTDGTQTGFDAWRTNFGRTCEPG
jgi:hypothetical protein